jgi:hypothetical protein
LPAGGTHRTHQRFDTVRTLQAAASQALLKQHDEGIRAVFVSGFIRGHWQLCLV